MYKVGVMIFYNNRGEILLYLRDNKPTIPFPHYWDLFGGATEPGETHEEAVIREVEEELGIKLDKTEYLFFNKYRFYEKKVGWHYKYIYYSELNKSASEMNLYEGEKLGFFTEEQIESMKIPASLKKIILDFIQFKIVYNKSK